MIRVLNEADAKSYRALRLRALKDHPEAFSSTYEREYAMSEETFAERLRSSDERFTLGAFDANDQLVGNVTFVRETNPKLAHKGNVFAMYVVPESRTNGRGKVLMRELIRRCTQLDGLEQLNLMVTSTNLPARRLYLAVGFEIFGCERNAMKVNSQYIDEDYMVLRLKSDAKLKNSGG